MRKYGRAFLIAITSILTIPAAQAEGAFFIGGQGGEIELDDIYIDDNKTDMQTLNLGYRWQAGSIVQVGLELGGGKLDTLSEGYTEVYEDAEFSENAELDASYAFVGANARFQFGTDSRLFAIVRLGYMDYEEKWHHSYDYRYYDGNGEIYRDSDSDTDKESGGGAYFSAGLGVDITPNINITLTRSGYAYSPSFGEDYDSDDDFDEDDFHTASSTNLGLEIRF